MLMSPSPALERFFGTVETYPELAGKRVLVVGVTARHGIDIARAFAEHRARLVLHVTEPSPETETLGEVLAPVASDLAIYTDPLRRAEDIVALARKAISVFGGIDAVVVLVPLAPPARPDLSDIEAEISNRLLAPCLIARVAANRMKLFGTGGTILHVAHLDADADATAHAFAVAVKATLSTMVRVDAATWAPDGIRVAAVAPPSGRSGGHGLAGEPDIAALALFLAAGRGASLTGQMFEADARA